MSKKKENLDICDRDCSKCAYQDNSCCPIYKPQDSFLIMMICVVILGICIFALSQLLIK